MILTENELTMDVLELSSSSDELDLTINTAYASKYDQWRSKEEYQKLKDKYGDVDLDDVADDSFDSSSSEDEDAVAFTPVMEKDFLRTLAALKSRNPKIYDPAVNFFQETAEQASETAEQMQADDRKKTKPMFLKDYEREVILKRDGKFTDDESESEQEGTTQPAGYYEEQEAIRQSFKIVDVPAGVDDDDNLLSLRVKSKEELVKEEEEYLEWLKGQKQTLSKDKSIAAELKSLRQYWTDPALDDGERFLRDYLLNKEYMEEDEETIPSYAEIVHQLEDDEKELDRQEQFEKKYNFRFEEPDAEIIRSYPRVIPETLRNKDSRRVKARLAVRERKRLEKEKRREELKRLKNLKRREIVDKIEKLKDVAGDTAVGFTEEDVEGEFNEREYDEMMKKVFDDGYYCDNVDKQKPVFIDEDDDDENWDDWQRPTHEQQQAEYTEQQANNYEPHCDDPGFIMDADYDPTQRRVKTKKKKKGKSKLDKNAMQEELTSRKRRRRSKFAEALEKPKPQFDSNEKTFEEYFDEYYQLDYEDVVADMPVRFKYRKVVPNDFGLTVDEVLSVPDKELNTWVSVKKMSQYRDRDEEDQDVRIYQRKSHSRQKKLNILTSLQTLDAQDAGDNTSVSRSKKHKPETVASESRQVDVVAENKSGKKDATAAANTKVYKDKKRKNKEERIDTSASAAGESRAASTHKKRKKDAVDVEASNMAPDNTNCTSTQNPAANKKRKKKKKKKKNSGTTLPIISDDRLKAYGINPKKFKYFHQKNLLKEQK